jgi:shikimate dehydrogenase
MRFTRDTYAVFGNPIGHSLSPKIHAAFARQTGQVLDYRAQLVPVDGFAQALDEFQQAGGKGLNVTVPFKQNAWAAMDQRSARAQQAGAVNTIWFGEDGQRIGDNTDGVGLVRDLTQNLGWPLAGRTVLILGAGGAVRGVLPPLLAAGPARVVIANRTVARAEELVAIFRQPMLSASAYPALAGQHFDLLINGTSAGLQGESPPLPEDIFAPGGQAYDMLYGQTVFVAWAQERGARTADGLGMLVEQAAEAFYSWRGVRPETAPVIRALREGMRA